MNFVRGIIRSLVLLLILRVVVAPVSFQLTPLKPPTAHNHAIIRTRACPTQWPQRLGSACLSPSRFRGGDPEGMPEPQPRDRDVSPSMTRARLSLATLHARQNHSSVHLSDCPRC